MWKHIIFPTPFPERPRDGQGRSYGGNDGHGIVRVNIHPPIEKAPQQSWVSALKQLLDELELDVGKRLGERAGESRVGPCVVRYGKHPQFGLVAAALAVAVHEKELTIVGTFEMGDSQFAEDDLKAFYKAFVNIEIVDGE